jgi:hypothetical protein
MKTILRFIATLVMIVSGASPVSWAQPAVPFVSGGIGIAEQEVLRAREAEFNLKLVFTLVEGNYLADVKVTIRDGMGAVLLDHVSGGPLLLARLPQGRYSLSATYRGTTQTREMRIGERLHTEYLRWPSDPRTDFPLKATRGSPARVAAPAPAAATPVQYVSGGIGVAEQEALKAREAEFNLKLVFTLVEGNYVADVRVLLRDGKGGVIIDDVASGPIFLARLPAGTYTIEATYRDRTVTRKAAVDGRLHTEYLRWPSNPAADFPLPPEHRVR